MTLLVGDVRTMLKTLPEKSVHCAVTSPPYYALRDYGTAGQIGLESTPEEYIAVMVDVFREVRRVMRDDGTCWLNIGDSYTSGGRDSFGPFTNRGEGTNGHNAIKAVPRSAQPAGMKPKDLMGIPWMLAFALRTDGWYLRSEIIWHKPNPMPESVTDRPTKAHEQIFLLTKSAKYFFDQEAVREAQSQSTFDRFGNGTTRKGGDKGSDSPNGLIRDQATNSIAILESGRNLRSVWTIATEAYSEAHFATFPKAIPERCIKAGTSEKGCCATCGKPWERVIEKERMPTRPGDKTKVEGTNSRFHISRDCNHPTELNGKERLDGLTTGNRDPQRHVTESVTTGWEPGCTCGGEPAPCTVLDPFFGSGTTGVVAEALGRDWIGIELNPVYAELAKKRIARGYDPTPTVPVLAGQKKLDFGEAT